MNRDYLVLMLLSLPGILSGNVCVGRSFGGGVVVGPKGGAATWRSVQGAGGGAAAQGAAVGPNGGVAAGAAVRGADGGYAAGFAAVSPSGRYSTASAVRGNFNNYGLYGQGWNVDHPGAWMATGWAANDAWLPLGVFALSKDSQTKSNVAIQLAVNKQGILRGNYTDTALNKSAVIQGSVDKQTQRVAFTVGTDTKDVIGTGLYNLTKDEAPVIIHFGSERTEPWLLVRLKDNSSKQPPAPSDPGSPL